MTRSWTLKYGFFRPNAAASPKRCCSSCTRGTGRSGSTASSTRGARLRRARCRLRRRAAADEELRIALLELGLRRRVHHRHHSPVASTAARWCRASRRPRSAPASSGAAHRAVAERRELHVLLDAEGEAGALVRHPRPVAGELEAAPSRASGSTVHALRSGSLIQSAGLLLFTQPLIAVVGESLRWTRSPAAAARGR